MDNDFDCSEDCFLVLTRPSLTWGVPIEGLILNLGVCLISGVVFSSPSSWVYNPLFMGWGWIPAIHFGMRQIVAWDYHGFRLLRLWFEDIILAESDTLMVTMAGPYRSAAEVPSSV